MCNLHLGKYLGGRAENFGIDRPQAIAQLREQAATFTPEITTVRREEDAWMLLPQCLQATSQYPNLRALDVNLQNCGRRQSPLKHDVIQRQRVDSDRPARINPNLRAGRTVENPHAARVLPQGALDD